MCPKFRAFSELFSEKVRIRSKSPIFGACENSAHQGTACLVQHVSIVHQQIQYDCEHCDYSAFYKSNLNRHVASVRDVIRYGCEK